ncbi:MAG: hypothetical protein ACOX8S_07945 [Christensenellales bacterium]|jgi:hypothetical protein
MYYEFNAPTGIAPAGAATEIIILVLFIVAILRVVIVSARKKAEFDQYQKTKEQYQNPDLKPIVGYQQRDGKAATPSSPPNMSYTLSQRAPKPFVAGFTERREGTGDAPGLKAAASADSHGQIRQPREPKHGKTTDIDNAYSIKARHGSHLNLNPASLRKVIIAKELLDRPVSMREKRGCKVAR